MKRILNIAAIGALVSGAHLIVTNGFAGSRDHVTTGASCGCVVFEAGGTWEAPPATSILHSCAE